MKTCFCHNLKVTRSREGGNPGIKKEAAGHQKDLVPFAWNLAPLKMPHNRFRGQNAPIGWGVILTMFINMFLGEIWGEF